MKHSLKVSFAAIAISGAALALSACAPAEESARQISSTGLTSASSDLDNIDVGNSEALLAGSVTGATSGVVRQLVAESSRPEVVVYKSESCGCCKDWVAYLENEGFAVHTFNHDNIDQIRAEHGLTAPGLKSCHTALVDGYVIEGHVPVSDIDRLLAERADIVGLTAPGMPMMSPGMGSLTPRDYDVRALKKDGSSRIYSSY